MCRIQPSLFVAFIYLALPAWAEAGEHAQSVRTVSRGTSANVRTDTAKNAIAVTSSGVLSKAGLDAVVHKVAVNAMRDPKTPGGSSTVSAEAHGLKNASVVRRVMQKDVSEQREADDASAVRAEKSSNALHGPLGPPIAKAHFHFPKPNLHSPILYVLAGVSLLVLCTGACLCWLHDEFYYLRARPSSASARSVSSIIKKAGKKEMPQSIDELQLILEADSRVLLDRWAKVGTKSVEDLYQELLQGGCDLQWAREANGEYYLLRAVRVLTVVVRATTIKGVRVLKQGSVLCHNSRQMLDTHGEGRDVARKIKKGDNIDEAIEALLKAELGLDAAYQQEHFIKEGTTRRTFRNDEKFGKRFPGLGTQYVNVEVRMQVKDPNHPACAVLGLPEGKGITSAESTFMTNKERGFLWTVPENKPKDDEQAIEEGADGKSEDEDEEDDNVVPLATRTSEAWTNR